MSGWSRVRIIERELPEEAEVYVHNTVPSATIDLSAGFVTKNPYGTAATIRAMKTGTYQYSAILVPQRIDNSKPLVEVVMKGVAYLVESRFVFKPGISTHGNGGDFEKSGTGEN